MAARLLCDQRWCSQTLPVKLQDDSEIGKGEGPASLHRMRAEFCTCAKVRLQAVSSMQTSGGSSRHNGSACPCHYLTGSTDAAKGVPHGCHLRTDLLRQVSHPMDLATLLMRVDAREIPTVKAFLDTAALIPAAEQQFWGSDPEGIREVSLPEATPFHAQCWGEARPLVQRHTRRSTPAELSGAVPYSWLCTPCKGRDLETDSLNQDAGEVLL